jgi:Outer membrane protein beta-barrel domain
MKTALVLATGLMALSSTASAGTYLGLALGDKPGVSDDLDRVAPPDGHSARLLGGYRFGNVSIEGAINGFGVVTGLGEHTVYQLSAAGKYNLPLGDGFEVLGRAGLEHTALDLGNDRYNLAGNGFLIGAGFEYRLELGVTSASIFVDYTIHHATLEDARPNQIDATSRILALGFTVGL